ncbi:hypothetical protein NUW58_g1509 [Xylaria curta]|uniref:Uncharacterized protein n=1 Tax=Xylaria curta TaxID=42375 RepID=A0ACC1PN72_9PEZI|nr:hypothetical protein NUW58_g1509 [Xylaria curta]
MLPKLAIQPYRGPMPLEIPPEQVRVFIDRIATRRHLPISLLPLPVYSPSPTDNPKQPLAQPSLSNERHPDPYLVDLPTPNTIQFTQNEAVELAQWQEIVGTLREAHSKALNKLMDDPRDIKAREEVRRLRAEREKNVSAIAQVNERRQIRRNLRKDFNHILPGWMLLFRQEKGSKMSHRQNTNSAGHRISQRVSGAMLNRESLASQNMHSESGCLPKLRANTNTAPQSRYGSPPPKRTDEWLEIKARAPWAGPEDFVPLSRGGFTPELATPRRPKGKRQPPIVPKRVSSLAAVRMGPQLLLDLQEHPQGVIHKKVERPLEKRAPSLDSGSSESSTQTTTKRWMKGTVRRLSGLGKKVLRRKST